MGETDQQTAIIRQLFDEYADSLYRYAKYSLPPDMDARDVVQEVFLRAFRSWHGFQGQSSAKTWLYQIARNHIYDLLRKKPSTGDYEPYHQCHISIWTNPFKN
ncbi:RNA polymerase sigma factor [Alicyclobacillus mengziensis]|uniref:Sigma-70 family RNA polymerase sigma factor n=1 Tax=Alicyclobacillus mengziensis TaxID=2931921 RepID=A0A9X7VWX1_9BACL|nr:sigma-70 family RNA polymerase sigma factor [Alicyclobacillus mengziensis]QSO46080.1 sigma-70 family RNA polymerase sigma factor [Alicyclobacillus mengziensis]